MTQKPTGRPTVITKATVQKLETALRDGFSVEMACHVSGVGRSTYYQHLNSDPDFADKMAWILSNKKVALTTREPLSMLHISNRKTTWRATANKVWNYFANYEGYLYQ